MADEKKLQGSAWGAGFIREAVEIF